MREMYYIFEMLPKIFQIKLIDSARDIETLEKLLKYYENKGRKVFAIKVFVR